MLLKRLAAICFLLQYEGSRLLDQALSFRSDMASDTLPTRVLAGVAVPDTPLITKALDLAKEHSTDYTYNHIVRSLLFGFLIADKIPHTKERDREAHAVAGI